MRIPDELIPLCSGRFAWRCVLVWDIILTNNPNVHKVRSWIILKKPQKIHVFGPLRIQGVVRSPSHPARRSAWVAKYPVPTWFPHKWDRSAGIQHITSRPHSLTIIRWTNFRASAIHTSKYRIPSDLRSQTGNGLVSTTVGDHVGILGADVFSSFFLHRLN